MGLVNRTRLYVTLGNATLERLRALHKEDGGGRDLNPYIERIVEQYISQRLVEIDVVSKKDWVDDEFG